MFDRLTRAADWIKTSGASVSPQSLAVGCNSLAAVCSRPLHPHLEMPRPMPPVPACSTPVLLLLPVVGGPGSLEKDMLPPFSEDIQKFLHIKIPTLQKTSVELVREFYPEITSMVPLSPLETSGKNNGNDQSFFSSSHDHVNTDNHGCSRDNSDLQRENLTVFVNETDTRDAQKNPVEPTPDLSEPSTLYRRCYDRPQEITIGASVRSAGNNPIIDDRNMSITAEPASATCGDALLRSNTELLLSKKDVVETTMPQEKSPTTNLQPGSCRVKYQNPSHSNDGERPHDDGTNIQASKDLSHHRLTMQATVAPDSDRSTDALPTYTSEKSHLPEFVAADDTMIARPLGRKTRNSPQHDRREKASQGLDEGSARIQLAAKDVEVSCADKANPSLQDDGNMLKKNTSCGGQTAIDFPCCNVGLHNKSSEVDSLSEKNTENNMADRSVPNSPQDGNKEGTKRAANKEIMGNAVGETSNLHCSDESSSGLQNDVFAQDKNHLILTFSK